MLYAPVQSDKTADSMHEMLMEAQGLVGEKPLSDAEIAKVKQGDVRALPGQFEGNAAVMGSVQNILVYHRPDDYVQTLKQHIEGQKDDAIEAAAKEVVKPASLTWVVVGDRQQIEKSIKDLKIGDVQVLDADGNVVH
jgi:predicted Zn-dependent peptidase